MPLVKETLMIGDATFVLRRDCGMLPAYIPGLQLGCPSNHVFQFTCDASRFVRDHLLWQDAIHILKTNFPNRLKEVGCLFVHM